MGVELPRQTRYDREEGIAMNLTEKPKSVTGEFPHWVDPDSGQEYVLIPVEHYQKLRMLLDGITRRSGWDDPALDIYEDLRKKP